MRRYVQLPRAMAAFTPGIGERFLSGSDTFEMCILVKREPDVGMAGLANGAPDIGVLLRIGGS
jgi:hypothetical protein